MLMSSKEIFTAWLYLYRLALDTASARTLSDTTSATTFTGIIVA